MTKQVLMHVKAQVGAREETYDIEAPKTYMLRRLEDSLRSRELLGNFNRIMVFIYPNAPSDAAGE